MAETLGSLCDKLTIVKLKQWHTEDKARLKSLSGQETQLENEIDNWIQEAVSGKVPLEKLQFAANKVYPKKGNAVENVEGTIGRVFAQLARVNCDLWHEQEKVYEFEKVPARSKNQVIKRLAVLNLERNQCIDAIDRSFVSTLKIKK